MPQVTADAHVPVDPATAFAVSQTTGELRLRWDPFIRHQHFVDGATAPGKGVRRLTRARVGPQLVSEYVSYRPPTSVGMTMVEGAGREIRARIEAFARACADPQILAAVRLVD